MSRFLILLTFSSLILAACGDNLPTGTSDDSENESILYDTTLTDNSFALSGAGYQESRVDMSAGLNEGWQYMSNGGMTMLVQSSYVDHPGKIGVNMTVVLQFPSRRGQHAWENLFLENSDSTTIYAAATVAGKKYVSVEGTTEVIFMNDAFNEIVGRYSGTLVSAFGDTLRISDGRFTVLIDR